MKYLKSYIFYNESVRDFLKPKSKEEVIKQLGGRENVVFKPTNKYLEQSVFIGKYETSYKNLVKIFGKPNGEGDNYKISTEWVLEDDKGNIVSISDYKMTNLYDSSYPSVYKFRNELSYDWNIFSDNKEILKDLKTYIYIKELSLNESIKNFLKPKSENDVKTILNNLLNNEYGAEDTLSKIYDYDLKYLYSNDELKEIINKLSISDQLYYILEYELVYLYNEDEITELINKDDTIDLKINYILDNFIDLYSDKKLKNIILSSNQNIDTILDIIHIYYKWDIFSKNDIKKLISKITDDYDRLHNIFEYNLQHNYTKTEILQMYNKLNREDKINLKDFFAEQLSNILSKKH